MMTMMMRITFPRDHSRRVYSYFFATSNFIRRSNDSQFFEGLPSLPYFPSHRNLRSIAGLNDSIGQKKENQTSNGNDFVKNYFKNVNSLILRTRLNVHKVFEVNTKEQLQEKLAFLEANLSLSEKKLHSVLYFHPMLLNRSKEDMERLVRHFREKWHCSDEEMRELLLTTGRAKKIIALSLEDLERMHRVYSEEWKISDDKLSSRLLDRHCWYKYQRHLNDSKKEVEVKSSENMDHREKTEKIRSFFSREFGIKFIELIDIDRIINSKIFDENSEEELKQKIHYLSSKSSLDLSTQEIKRLVQFVPVILNESMEEMEKKVEYFKVKLGCSEEELKRIYLIRGVVVSQAMWRLELLYRILGEEYGLKVEEIKKLMMDPNFVPDRLSDMMKDVVERKHIFSLIFTTQSHLILALRVAPQLLWMSVPTLKSKMRLFVEGLGLTSPYEIRRIPQNGALNMEEQHIATNCKQILSLLMSPSSVDWDGTKMVHLQDLESEEKRRLEEAFRAKYRKEIKMLESDSPREERERAKQKKKERGSEREVHAAFIEEKAATLSALSSADSSSWSLSRATRAWSIAAIPSASDIANPYHRFLRECLEEEKRGDLLKELGGYEEERERIEKALRRGEGREKEGAIEEEEEGKEVGWMAMGLVGGKEVEKMALSHEEAKKICISSTCIGHNFSTVLPKLISMASRLQLTGEESMSIFRRNPNLTCLHPDGNILPKLLEVGRAAERFVRDGGGGGSEGMEAWKNGIGEAMSVEEGREYYRKHPVVRLMREFVLQNPSIFTRSMDAFKAGIKQWEEDGKEQREWRNLNILIVKV